MTDATSSWKSEAFQMVHQMALDILVFKYNIKQLLKIWNLTVFIGNQIKYWTLKLIVE